MGIWKTALGCYSFSKQASENILLTIRKDSTKELSPIIYFALQSAHQSSDVFWNTPQRAICIVWSRILDALCQNFLWHLQCYFCGIFWPLKVITVGFKWASTIHSLFTAVNEPHLWMFVEFMYRDLIPRYFVSTLTLVLIWGLALVLIRGYPQAYISTMTASSGPLGFRLSRAVLTTISPP